MCHGGPLKLVADYANLIETVPAAVAFHAMAQHANRVEVALFQAGLDRREIPLPVGKESGDDRFKAGIDTDGNLVGAWFSMMVHHCARVFS